MHSCASRLPGLPRLVGATLLAALSLAATALGPPTICHPLDIGQAKSLPWGSSGFQIAADYDVARTVDDTLAILRASPDTLVHMETLRRAAIYLTPLSGAGEARPAAWRAAQLARLASALEADVAQLQPADKCLLPAPAAAAWGDGAGCAAVVRSDADAALGLRSFDVGYLQAILWQAGQQGTQAERDEQRAEFATRLEKASALRPDDGALHLGIALATYDGRTDSAACYAHLERVVALAAEPDGLLRRNLMSTMGSFLGASSYDDLVAKVAARGKRA